MKIKTRLAIYNIILILTSAILIVLALWYVQESSHQALKNFRTMETNDGTFYYAPQKPEDFDDTKIPESLEMQNDELFSGELKFSENFQPREDLPEPFRKPYFAMLIAMAAVLAAVILLSFILSNHILKKVLDPIKLLEQGAARVQAGDFSTPIDYTENTEFTSVINAFNEMQAELLAKNQRAAADEAAKKRMVNGISHDLRTPLTAVKGSIKGIQDGIASSKEKQQQYLATAYARAIDIENLTNKLFETFNYETGELKLNLKRTDLEKFIKEIVNNNEQILMQRAKVRYIFPEEKIFAMIDPTEIKRVFDNLINNAIKHSGEKVPQLKIKLKKNENEIEIDFSDNGKGVDAKNLALIFDEFYKEDFSRNQDKNSSGLGLFIVKRIVEAHGGKISAENSNGLCFKIFLKEANE